MSVEKLAIIRQRLAETRSKTSTPSLTANSTVTSRRGLYAEKHVLFAFKIQYDCLFTSQGL